MFHFNSLYLQSQLMGTLYRTFAHPYRPWRRNQGFQYRPNRFHFNDYEFWQT